MFSPTLGTSNSYVVSSPKIRSLLFPFMVPIESLMVASEADDSHLMSLLKQVDRVLLSLHGSVVVEGLHSWGTVVEVRRQHYFSSVGQEEGHEPCGSV